MRLLICAQDVDPCPPDQMRTLTIDEATDPGLLGFTPGAVAKTWAFGFGAVMVIWAIGYVVQIAVGMIKKL